LNGLLSALADVVFPPVCVHCRGLVEDSGFRSLCACCAREIVPAGGPPERPGPDQAFGRGCAAVMSRGPARALVIELKYHRGLHVLADMGEVFRKSAAVVECARGSILVPVPLHPRKLRERGFNQSALLAEALAAAAGGGATLAHLLRRTVDTPTQTALDRPGRRANLKNAFALAGGRRLDPRQHYILVDDVFTTGSTLDSCARVLRRAGCLNLDVITFGHG